MLVLVLLRFAMAMVPAALIVGKQPEVSLEVKVEVEVELQLERGLRIIATRLWPTAARSDPHPALVNVGSEPVPVVVKVELEVSLEVYCLEVKVELQLERGLRRLWTPPARSSPHPALEHVGSEPLPVVMVVVEVELEVSLEVKLEVEVELQVERGLLLAIRLCPTGGLLNATRLWPTAARSNPH